MAEYKLIMPKLGESVQEATITKWLVKPGDIIEEDGVLLEIATDKVDSEIPSPVAGKVIRILFAENALVPVGEIIAIINTEGVGEVTPAVETKESVSSSSSQEIGSTETVKELKTSVHQPADGAEVDEDTDRKSPASQQLSRHFEPIGETGSKSSGRFYSPLVMSIAAREGISGKELEQVTGTGDNGRVRKQDLVKYLETRGKKPTITETEVQKTGSSQDKIIRPGTSKPVVVLQPGDEIVQMDRMRKLIAEHMVMSKHTAPHVTNFVEADVTNLALWREKNKDAFQKREKIKLTFMPAFIEATAKALKEFPGVNASVDEDRIILRKNINIGIAVALKSGNLIVPVLRNADQKSMVGLAVDLSRLSDAARTSSLSPDDIQGGTFTISNFGSFRNITGTPIINQPQVAILATGNIEKKPAVLETPSGDVIAIRHKMILSLSYDHRIVDGALAGMFLRRIADILEEFDINKAL
jgi:2-oxoglutarate dehydrogenase E2 component (dihydrolipoamide succinyltransferase)